MPSRGQELVAGDHFSFSSDSIDGVKIDDEHAYGIAFRSWSSETVKGGGGVTYGAWAQWSCVDCDGLDDGDDHLKWLANAKGCESRDVDLKVQAIANYRKEMLDLINDVPEYADELSFRDLVELPRIAKAGQDSPTWGARSPNDKSRGKREENKVKKGRNSSEGNGFFIKMFFPIPTNRRMSSCGSPNGSPRPSFSNPSSESNRALLKDEEKAGAAKNMEGKRSKKHHHVHLSKNPSRRPRGCIAFFQKNKGMSPKI